MGFDPVTGIGTGCWPGMRRLAAYLFDRFGGWDLGCFNPRSMAGGGPSLHAEGRAQDFAFNAHDPDERAAGDALFTWAVLHADEIGLQEMLWRGAIWYWPRRNSEHGWGDFQLPGVYGPVQQGPHETHVHMGIDKHAGMNWQIDWLTPDPQPEPDPPKMEANMRLFHDVDSDTWAFWSGINWQENVPEDERNALIFAGVPWGDIHGPALHRVREVVGQHVQALVDRIRA